MTLRRFAGRAHVPFWHSPAQYCTVQLIASTELRTTASPESSLPAATYREPDQATLCRSFVTPDVRAVHVASSADATNYEYKKSYFVFQDAGWSGTYRTKDKAIKANGVATINAATQEISDEDSRHIFLRS